MFPNTARLQMSPYKNCLLENTEHQCASESQVPCTETDATHAPSPWWVSKHQISLLGLDLFLFKHFVHFFSKTLDFHDQELHFARTVPHLALKNMGLMKALLALSAHHLSLKMKDENDFNRAQDNKESSITANDQENANYRDSAVKYYFESIHHLNSAMQSSSHTQSLELATAAMLISTYEMFDESYQNWRKHIQGIFWLQSLQQSHGESGGLRSAIWWAWFQQDIWIAMQERRCTYSIWEPQRSMNTLSAPELARHAFYLLAQCVNYISQDEKGQNSKRRAERGDELLRMLQKWRETLPQEFDPLPLTSNDYLFPVIWVNPSSYAAALQIQSLALILVVLHHPLLNDGASNKQSKHILKESVNNICGIARSVHADDIGANFISLKCLYEGKTS